MDIATMGYIHKEITYSFTWIVRRRPNVSRETLGWHLCLVLEIHHQYGNVTGGYA